MKQHHHSTKTSGTVSLWHVLYLVFFGWMAALYYYHHNHHAAPSSTSSSSASGSTGKTVVFQKFVASQTLPPSTLAILSQAHNNLRTDNTDANQVDITPSKTASTSSDRMHIVFSTDCTFFQDWQTLLLFYSAQKAHQPGDITRIASGCSPDKQRELTELYQKLFPRYHAHFTPDFKTDNKTKKSYDFYNKPFGLHHWLQHANPPVEDGVVVILIDPDMIILRPFTLDLAGNPENLFLDKSLNPKDPNLPKKIGKGVPVAQMYGLGAPWAIDGHRHFNRRNICGENSPCLQVTRHYGEMHYR